jgi:hypothetical protein
MAANPSIANLNLFPRPEQALSESNKPKLESLLDRIKAALCKYFGENEETILNRISKYVIRPGAKSIAMMLGPIGMPLLSLNPMLAMGWAETPQG